MPRPKGTFNQIQYNNDYTRDNYARLAIFVPKASKQPILDHLTDKGYKSLNSYVQALIARDLGVSDLSELIPKQEKAD